MHKLILDSGIGGNILSVARRISANAFPRDAVRGTSRIRGRRPTSPIRSGGRGETRFPTRIGAARSSSFRADPSTAFRSPPTWPTAITGKPSRSRGVAARTTSGCGLTAHRQQERFASASSVKNGDSKSLLRRLQGTLARDGDASAAADISARAGGVGVGGSEGGVGGIGAGGRGATRHGSGAAARGARAIRRRAARARMTTIASRR